jgi:uncharacterized protein (DUF39 family)
MCKSINEMDGHIHDGSARIIATKESRGIIDELDVSGVLREVDTVTTGTINTMCSSRTYLNFEHSDIFIQTEEV